MLLFFFFLFKILVNKNFFLKVNCLLVKHHCLKHVLNFLFKFATLIIIQYT